MDKKSRVLNILKAIWGVAVVAGGIYYVVKNYSTAIQYLSSINAVKLLLCALLIIVVRVQNVELVQQSLVLVGWKPNFKNAFSFVSISQLGKYIPGGVWQFFARFEAYKEANITYKNMGKAFIVENVWLVAGSFFVSLAFLLLSRPIELLAKYGFSMDARLYPVLGAAALLLWLITVAVSELVIRGKGAALPLGRTFYIFASQSVLWILYGISFFCLFSQTGTLNDLFFTIGAFGLSFLAGYVIVIAPGGLGVREAVAVLLFSLMFSSSEIGIYTIVHRLLYTLVEFLLAGVALTLTPKKKLAAETPVSEDK